jgi:hypothetical protein
MNATMNDSNSTREKVILVLLGIEKKWVRSDQGQWTEYIESKHELTNHEEPITKTKKWWQFWKKS